MENVIYCKIRAVNDNGNGNYSTIVMFTIKDKTVYYNNSIGLSIGLKI